LPRIALVVSAGSGGGVDPSEVAGRLEALGATVRAFEREDFAGAADWDPDRFVAAGGDGTIAPVAAAAGAAGVPLGVIPAGTANNFARAAELPTDLEQACRLAARGERLRDMELGRAGELPFVNLASAGLAPVAARRAARWKRLLGPTAYAVGAAAAAVTTSPLDYVVSGDGGTRLKGRAWQVMVAVSGAFGTGLKVEPADTGDGQLDLVVVEAGPRIRLLASGYRLRSGQVVGQPGVSHARAPSFDLQVPPGAPFNVDGEVAELGPTQFTVERAGFQLVTS
jgi:diacylglycerol kinase family enzyme